MIQALLIARAPQSANDMRSKGENRRFMDETGYLLDGIEDESATKGFRRARYVELAHRSGSTDEPAVLTYSGTCKAKNGCRSLMFAGRRNESGQLSKVCEAKAMM